MMVVVAVVVAVVLAEAFGTSATIGTVADLAVDAHA